MSEIKTKRVYELEKGDIFTYGAVRKVVTRVEDGRVYYNFIDISHHDEQSFGGFNQMKVQYHGRKESVAPKPKKVGRFNTEKLNKEFEEMFE